MNYVEIYKTVIAFHRKHSKIENTDQYWESVVEDSEQISKKYGCQKFVVDLLAAVILELERKAKEAEQ